MVAAILLAVPAMPQTLPPAGADPIARALPPAPLPPSAPLPAPATAAGRAAPQGAAPILAIDRARLQGSSLLPADAFAAELADLAGRAVPPAEVEALRQAVLQRYRAAGYPYVAVNAVLSRSPEEGAGELVLVVAEGFIAEILLDGDIGPAGTQALRFLNPLLAERPLPTAALERAMLLVSDLPGVSARALLRPAPREPGALTLVVQLRRQAASGLLNLDNRGSTTTGREQLVAGLTVSSLSSLAERTDVSLLHSGTSLGRGQNFLQVGQELFLGGSGLRLRAHAGLGATQPGGALAAIGYRGETQVLGIGGSYPLLRRRPANLSLGALLEAVDSRLLADLPPDGARGQVSLDRVRVLRLGAEGSLRDALLPVPAAATTQAAFRLHQGIPALGASSGDAPGTSRLGAEFGFTKLTLDMVRSQPLRLFADGSVLGLQATLGGQWTADALPSSEKFYLGGNRLGRGFVAGQVTGDRAVGGGVEVQYTVLPDNPAPSLFAAAADLADWTERLIRPDAQYYLFLDAGRSFEVLPGDPDRRLASWGGGVRLTIAQNLSLELEGVWRLTRRPSGAEVEALPQQAAFGRLTVRY
jgi:hemolysin activation/secretion protein